MATKKERKVGRKRAEVQAVRADCYGGRAMYIIFITGLSMIY